MVTFYEEKNIYYNDRSILRMLNLITSYKLMKSPLTHLDHVILERLKIIEHLLIIIDPLDPTDVTTRYPIPPPGLIPPQIVPILLLNPRMKNHS